MEDFARLLNAISLSSFATGTCTTIMLMRIVVALLLVETSKCQDQPTDALIILETTEPPVATTEGPTVADFTSVQIVAQGGEGTCRWRTGAYGPCSATCEGTSTREVFCSCTLSDGNAVKATEDNCDRDSSVIRPINQRTCGIECPVPTSPPQTTTAARATTATPTQPTTEAPSTTGPTTDKPTTEADLFSGSGTFFTADDVIRRGGQGNCRWGIEPYSDCSATCEGIQTRDVFCSCTLSGGAVVRATGDNCDRDDLRVEPISQRSCNPECPEPTTIPPTTPSPTTEEPTTEERTTAEPTTEERTTAEPTTEEPTCTTPERGPRECNLAECQDSSDCYDDECCLQVYAKYDAVNFYCFPLLEMGDVCDVEANWTCPCGAGLQCQHDTNELETLTREKRSHKKRDKYYSYRPRVSFKSKTDTCPSLYHKEPKRPKYHNAACVPGLMAAASVIAEGGEGTCRWETGMFSDCSATCNGIEMRDVFCTCTLSCSQVSATEDNCIRDDPVVKPIQSQSCDVECPTTTQPPPTPCELIQCNDDSDCQDDECCLEVEYREGKEYSVAKFCMPQVNESGVCDPNENWSCPCKDELNCMQQNGNKHNHKPKPGDAKKYRPKITLKEGDECPTVYKHYIKKGGKKDKYQHTCQHPSPERRR